MPRRPWTADKTGQSVSRNGGNWLSRTSAQLLSRTRLAVGFLGRSAVRLEAMMPTMTADNEDNYETNEIDYIR